MPCAVCAGGVSAATAGFSVSIAVGLCSAVAPPVSRALVDGDCPVVSASPSCVSEPCSVSGSDSLVFAAVDVATPFSAAFSSGFCEFSLSESS